jgi:hypothetical protein
VHLKVVSNGKSTDSIYTVTYQGGTENENQNIVTVYNSKKGKNGNAEDSIVEVNVITSDNESADNDGGGHRIILRRSRGGEDEEMEADNDEFPVSYSSSCSSCTSKCCNGDSSSINGRKKKVFVYIDEESRSAGKYHRMKYRMGNDASPDAEIEAQMEKIPLSTKDTTITHISPGGDTIKIHREVLKDGQLRQEVTVNKHSKDTSDNKYFTYKVRPGRNKMYFRNMGPSNGDETFAMMRTPMPPMSPDIEMNYDIPGMPEGIDENADFGKIKVTSLTGKNMVRISLELSGKETTLIKINDEKGRSIFEEKVKDLTGKYVRDIDMGSNAKGKYSLGIDRGKSSLTKSFNY